MGGMSDRVRRCGRGDQSHEERKRGWEPGCVGEQSRGDGELCDGRTRLRGEIGQLREKGRGRNLAIRVANSVLSKVGLWKGKDWVNGEKSARHSLVTIG